MPLADTREEFISPSHPPIVRQWGGGRGRERGPDLPDRFAANTMRERYRRIVITNAPIERVHDGFLSLSLSSLFLSLSLGAARRRSLGSRRVIDACARLIDTRLSICDAIRETAGAERGAIVAVIPQVG